MMGVASWLVWQNGGGAVPLSLYAVQLALNLAWTPLFFKEHQLTYALADITGGWLLCNLEALMLLKRTYNKSASLAAMTLLLQVCPEYHIKPHVQACCLHAGLAVQLPFESCVSCICALTTNVHSCLVHDSLLPAMSFVTHMLASDQWLFQVW